MINNLTEVLQNQLKRIAFQLATLHLFSRSWMLIVEYYTVWKFHDFCIIQILREINFRESRSAESAILTHLEALTFEIYLKFTKLTKLQAPKVAKTAVLHSPKLISRKI